MKKRTVKILLFIEVAFLLWGCQSAKKVVYMQDALPGIEKIKNEAQIRIKKDDLLAIFVNHKQTEAAAVFNLQSIDRSNVSGVNAVTGVRNLGYLVDGNGNIEFPILGTLHVEGLTRDELSDMIKEKLNSTGMLTNGTVTVQLSNLHVSVLGEVNNPRRISMESERLTLLDALAAAGDMTIYGRRDSVMILRDNGVEREVIYANLLSKDFLDSPAYYLQQNDAVYVLPNKIRAQQRSINQNNNIGVYLSLVSFIASMAILIWR